MTETVDIVCASCGARLQDAARYCPACGAPAPVMGSTGAGDGQIAALLAAASSALKRHDWVTAKDNCNEAMRREPENRSARTLMGDIYFSQHLYDDAVSWYQLAHDQDSANIAVQQKLDRAIALTRSRQRRAHTLDSGGDRPGTWRSRLLSAQAGVEALVRSRSFLKYVAYLTIVLGGLFFIAVMTGWYVRRADRGGSAVQPSYPSAQAPGASGSSRQPPQPTGPPSQVTSRPSTAAGQAAQPQPSSQFATGGIIPQESGLLSNLRRHEIVTRAGLDIQTLWADMRDQSVTVILRAEPGSGRRIVLTKAKDAARAIFALEPEARVVVVRVNEAMADSAGGTSLQIAFIGDIGRDNAAKQLALDASAESLEDLFGATYWHPSLRAAQQSSGSGQTAPSR